MGFWFIVYGDFTGSLLSILFVRFKDKDKNPCFVGVGMCKIIAIYLALGSKIIYKPYIFSFSSLFVYNQENDVYSWNVLRYY